MGCAKLSDIEIPSSVTQIENDAFVGCAALPEAVRRRVLEINPSCVFD